MEKCTEITSKGKRCKNNATKDDLCTRHYNHRRIKNGEMFIEHTGPTKECGNIVKYHISSGSKYPKERVPIENFRKPNKSDDDLYSTYIDCRNYGRNFVQKRVEKLIQQNEEQQKNDPNFGVCCAESHDIEGVSIYPRDKVPIANFGFKSKNAKGTSLNCIDCRTYIDNRNVNSLRIRQEKAEKENLFVCRNCKNKLQLDQRAINLDGTFSKYCISCRKTMKQISKERYKYLREIYRSIQLEMIHNFGHSCQHCKFIFLQPKMGTNYHVELPTYMKNENRYVDYEGKTYLTSVFLKEYEDLLELRIIEMDHLSEEEQRDRGII